MLATTFNIIVDYKEAFLHGLLVTFGLCLIIWSAGLILGTIIGYMGAEYPEEIGKPTRVLGFILGGVPVLVLLFWVYYPLQSLLSINVNPFIIAAAAISLVNIVTVADIVRTALLEFPGQYIIAGQVCGMGSKEIFKKIQFPIIFRQILPGLLTTQVTMLQLTLFASLISVGEIFRVAQEINSVIYKPVEIYTALAVFFLLICLPLNGLALWLKNRYTRNLSEK